MSCARPLLRRACLAALACLAGLLPARGARAMEDPGCGVFTLVLREGALAYALPRSFLRAGSDSVWTRAGPLERGVDYELDGLRGQVRLTRHPLPGDTLWFSGCWLVAPPPLSLRLMRYKPMALAGPDSASPAAAPAFLRPAVLHDPAAAPAGAALSLNGNKTIAVEFGSAQDAFLRQSLDLAISGTLAPGVVLTGVLSDRNTPLSGVGATRDLQSLERVRIVLQTPRGSASLGDVTLNLSGSEFGRLERHLQGVQGDWKFAGFDGMAAAANAQGVYHRVQFFGTDGRQGPYTLGDRDGGTGIAVVAGSEIVTLDGARLTRGEAADYSMDYERAQLTFSNRRPISSASRVTVEYQYAVNRFRRNLAAFAGRWQGGSSHIFTRVLSEGDDGGRPLDATLDAADRLVLEFAGDSAVRALANGIVNGGGDYDTVRVAGGTLAYAYAGPDSGAFTVTFARVGAGRGDYADSAVVAGRTAFRYAGPGAGTHVIGRPLPQPEAHQLWAAGGGAKLGALTIEAEGAVSRRDLNSVSALDDGDNLGGAGRAMLALEGALPGALGEAGVSVSARATGPRFAPFSRLERPFAQEDWGLPVQADLEHQQRVEVAGRWKPRRLGELRMSVARLGLPSGFESLRRVAEWAREGSLALRAAYERADATDPARRFPDGGRERARGEVRLRLPWLEPSLRVESDERTTPADTARNGDRMREAGVELATAQGFAWRARTAVALRRDAALSGIEYVDLRTSRTWLVTLDSPTGGMLAGGVALHRREVEPGADPAGGRSDLGSVRLSLDDPNRSLDGAVSLEITSEGQRRSVRTLTYVGGGRGAYDGLGNPVERGDYILGEGTSAALDRLARSAMSARLGWQFGSSDAWRGSRLEFAFESDARRRGEFQAADAVISPGAVLSDPGLARGSVLQRIEWDLAPGARAGALRLLAERRVTADRSYENFAQTQDRRALEARLRARPAAPLSAEISARLRREEATQALAGSPAYHRILNESGGGAQLVFTPDARLRVAGVADVAWVRPENGGEPTRTIRLGPDLGVTVLGRGRIEMTARRTVLSGPAPVTLLPGSDPLGVARWEGTSRFDYRLRESTTLGIGVNLREVPGREPLATGRAELRAFF